MKEGNMFKKISLIAGSILVIAGISFYIISTKNVSGEDAITMEYFNTTIKALEDKITILETKVNELEGNTSIKLNEIETKIDTNLQTTNVAINNVKTNLENKINVNSKTMSENTKKTNTIYTELNAIKWTLLANESWRYIYMKSLVDRRIITNPADPFK